MEATIKIKPKPFAVPNFVIAETGPRLRQDGFTEAPKYALSDLDPVTLDKLCEEFTSEVFKKASKQRPPQAI